uniref:Syntaxin-binding protein 5-like n=1 Tax=Neogobius melanostomus TaxID=47308 RepID=A0A8C6SG01_9GOBI
MKKFNTIRKVLDGLKEASSSAPSVQVGPQENHLIPESIQSEHFQLCKTVRHGFPYQPSAMAFDPVQKILAIGTQRGALRIFGRPGVECYCQHESGAAVIQLQFLINEGALVSALADDTVHLWNLRQKRPAVLHSLKFNRERITFCHLPFQSKWLYIGTERGNVHIVNVESFTLSGYVIMWNKAIELSSKAHPGPVVHISDNPMDEGKLIIGYESGIVALWDLKSKKAEYRYTYDEAIHSVAWHHEGKQFICSHSDGTLTIWNMRGQGKPIQTITPHGKQPKDGKKTEPCKPILKVEYKTTRNGEPFIILSGGLSFDTVGRLPCLTVMHGKSTAVLEMDYPIVDFLTLCETPYPNDFQEPYAVVVLLEKDLVVIDLLPHIRKPLPLTIHESPVTCCEYFADCPADLIPALYSAGSRQKRQGYSKREWPISGGNWGQGTQSRRSFHFLYNYTDVSDEDPFAIQILAWCPESRMLCVAGVSANLLIYRFSKLEVTTEVVQLLEVRMQCELNDSDSPDGGGEQTSGHPTPRASPQTSGPPSHPSTSSNNSDSGNIPCLKVRNAPLKQSPGYQVDLVVQLVWVSGEPPQQITSLALNSSYSLVVFGNSNGLAVVDYIQKTVVLNLGTVELYGCNDPYQRQLRSPRKSRQPSGGLCDINEGSATSEDRCKSPTSGNVLKWNALWVGALPVCLLSTVLLSVYPPRGANPLDRDNSFSRSRSSSVTSIDKEGKEAISSFHFCETYARKGDSVLTPCLYVGTSLGTVLCLAITMPPAGEQRQLQPVVISPAGMLVRLKGSVMRMSFLDATGSHAPPAYESWYEPNVTTDGEERVRKRRPVSVSPSTSQDLSENQYSVVCSEKQAKVVSLPSQTCIYKHSITESSFILRADMVQMSQGACLACFCANGHIMTLSLPGLRPLMDVNYLPLTDMRIARTFCFTNLGQAMYMCSPTEIQRITYSQEVCENLQEMLGELFTPVETPEAPNRGFFKGLFGGGAQSLDREELFGEVAAGKASRSLAQHIPGPGGMEGMKGAASGVVGELARARIALDERGQKLGELEDRTAAMMSSADNFSKHAHEMMLKCKDKKWYQF